MTARYISPWSNTLGVVGGGPVGLWLAAMWAQSGQNVHVFEKRAMPYWRHEESRVLVITHGSRLLLEQGGVWAACAEHAHPIEQVHVSEKGSWGRLRLSAATCQLPALAYALPFGRLMDALWSFVQSHGVHIHAQTDVADIKMMDTGCVIQGQTLEGLLLAEGGAGTLAATLGYGVPPSPCQHAQVWHVTWSGYPQKRACQRFVGSHVWGVVPAGGDNVVAVCTGDVCHLTPESLHEIMGHWGASPEHVALKGRYSLSVHVPRVQHRGCTALVGNAAHALLPIAAQGLNLGFRDVAVLWSLWTHKADRHSTVSDRLAAYVALRRQDVKRTYGLTQALPAVFALPKMRCVRSAMLGALQWAWPLHSAFIRQGTHLNILHDIL